MFLGTVVAAYLPAPRKQEENGQYWSNLSKVLTDRRWLSFFFSVSLFGMSLSILTNYFVLFFDSLGGEESLYGLSASVASLSELPVFAVSAIILRKRSAHFLITIGFLALVIKGFSFALIQTPEWAIPAQMLHGPTYAAMLVGGVNYVKKLSPPGMGASMQALLGAAMFGVSGSMGALIGSHLYDTVGPITLFRIAGMISLFGLLVFTISESILEKSSRESDKVLKQSALQG